MKKINSLQPATDPRWKILSHIQIAREAIGIKARSLTVLRGLLSFVSPAKWDAGELTVFPSNRALQERCDGMDERTLRRHLGHLCDAGVIQRNMSPNKKRYVVRDPNGTPILAYGFDLSGLKHHAERIEALSQEAKLAEQRIRNLKAILRDLMWKSGVVCSALSKLLRNKTSEDDLSGAIAELRSTQLLTDADGQIVRHIQNSNKEYIEEKTAQETALSTEDCVEAASNAVELSPEPIQNWKDLEALANTLAPAIGLHKELQMNAQKTLGEKGFTLAVLGLIQAFDRIKCAPSYLTSLCRKAENGRLNIDRMFRSLTRKSWFPAGNRSLQEI